MKPAQAMAGHHAFSHDGAGDTGAVCTSGDGWVPRQGCDSDTRSSSVLSARLFYLCAIQHDDWEKRLLLSGEGGTEALRPEKRRNTASGGVNALLTPCGSWGLRG